MSITITITNSSPHFNQHYTLGQYTQRNVNFHVTSPCSPLAQKRLRRGLYMYYWSASWRSVRGTQVQYITRDSWDIYWVFLLKFVSIIV